MGAWPVMCSGKWKKSDACLSEASCASLPFFTVHHWEPRRGRAFAVAFFCLLFLGEARKVSSCRATPGNALPSEENTVSVTTEKFSKRPESTPALPPRLQHKPPPAPPTRQRWQPRVADDVSQQHPADAGCWQSSRPWLHRRSRLYR